MKTYKCMNLIFTFLYIFVQFFNIFNQKKMLIFFTESKLNMNQKSICDTYTNVSFSYGIFLMAVHDSHINVNEGFCDLTCISKGFFIRYMKECLLCQWKISCAVHTRFLGFYIWNVCKYCYRVMNFWGWWGSGGGVLPWSPQRSSQGPGALPQAVAGFCSLLSRHGRQRLLDFSQVGTYKQNQNLTLSIFISV